MRSAQRGITTVEFAIVGLLLIIVVFGVIEIGRALFITNTLTEATRRGVRMAVVCPVGDPKPASVAVFDSGGGSSAIVTGLTTANVQIDYLDVSGAIIANPGNSANYPNIRYVRASIVGFTPTFVVPTLVTTISMNGFSATLPRESLGVTATAVTAC